MTFYCDFFETAPWNFPTLFSMHAIPLMIALAWMNSASPEGMRVTQIDEPMDALSVSLPSDASSAEISFLIDGSWSAWERLEIENEQDPHLRESSLIYLPVNADDVRIRSTKDVAIHPIRISKDPARYFVAATTNVGKPRVLSREEWGANDDLLYVKESSGSSAPSTPPSGDNGDAGTVPQRIKDCEEAQLNYPHEFKTERRTVKDEDGRRFRWTREYSKDVNLLVLHHTAVEVNGDRRSGIERIRALYQYHAVNRGWGDIGYHYLIDEDGQIYEGKSGGDYVVAGHAYCNNTGSVGVALLGNFQIEKPTQKQLKSLQWLLEDLAETYDINLEKEVKFHGKTMDPIVGHGELLSTECPGYYVIGSMSQIRKNVASGDVDAGIKLPPTLRSGGSSSSARPARQTVPSRSASSASTLPRRVQRVLDSEASRLLRRKLGSNPGKEIEDGRALRLAQRLGSSVSSRSSRSRSVSSARPTFSRISRSSSPSSAMPQAMIRIRLTKKETGKASCSDYNLSNIRSLYRGTVSCTVIDGAAALINTVSLEDYLYGLAEEPDTEPYEKQRAFAIAARTYAAYYMHPDHRKFPNMPYDGSDSPATFQAYGGIAFEQRNALWVKAVKSTTGKVLMKDDQIIRAPYFSTDDGRTRTPEEAGWNNFPFAEIFTSKEDPWCAGMKLWGHGVGMSGCGAEGQAHEGKAAEEILEYYYPGTAIERL